MSRTHKHQQYRQQLAPVDPGLRPGADGKLNPEAYRAYLEKRLMHGFNGKPSRLIDFVPPGGEEFGIKTGSAREWADFMTRLGFHEGELSTNGVGDGGRSHAIFGLSPGDSAIIGATHKGDLGRTIGGDFSIAELRDPRLHTDATIALLETKLLDKPQGDMRRSLSYWGQIKREHWKPGKGRDYVLREGADGKLAINRSADRPDGGIRNANYGKRIAQDEKKQKHRQQVAEMRAAGKQTTRRSKKHQHNGPRRDYTGRKPQHKQYGALGQTRGHSQSQHPAHTSPRPTSSQRHVATLSM